VADRQRSYGENLPFLSNRDNPIPINNDGLVRANGSDSKTVVLGIWYRSSANRLIIRLDILSGECNLAGM